ncbi:MAG TPA: hypothetical protein H9819_09755 [Candidatus Bacteroides merdipullorum]|uniref:Uncharacterized protein n=1 Tax=Candidatus Bacteroides merdipullorum TaxID=2838474 RepID=A0A9D2CXX2_9BACE|nr:hypothetical protein [Candidatus Bacteroides merdipullorum]
MAKKIGICQNLDCEYFNKTFEVEEGMEFCCPVCLYPLREKRVYVKKEKKIRIITK